MRLIHRPRLLFIDEPALLLRPSEAIELNDVRQRPQVNLQSMADTVRKMLRECLDAFVREDADLALSVCKEDDAIDAIHSQIFDEMLVNMTRNPSMIIAGTAILFVSKYLERIADHTTNIAEMVIFMAKGKSIRHLSVPSTI